MDKVKFAWSILATSVSINPENRAFSLIDLVEEVDLVNPQIKSDEAVVIPCNLLLVTTWLRDIGDNECEFITKTEFVSPKNEVLQTTPETVKIPKGSNRHRHLIKFNSIKIKEPGVYKFITKINGQDTITGSTELRINIK